MKRLITDEKMLRTREKQEASLLAWIIISIFAIFGIIASIHTFKWGLIFIALLFFSAAWQGWWTK